MKVIGTKPGEPLQALQVEDLEEICEDEIVKKLEPQTCLEILVSFEQNIKVSEETAYRVKTYFLKNFEHISTLYPDIEEKLAGCPGLIKKLFLHISGKRKFKRKVTFIGDRCWTSSLPSLLNKKTLNARCKRPF